MRRFLFLAMMSSLALRPAGQDYPVTPVPFRDVQVTEGFWQSRLETNRIVTIPFAFKKCEETGRISNFAVAGRLESGTFHGRRYDDSDVFKILEGASYSLIQHPDPVLDAYLDGVIRKIAAAQEPDGYLYTIRTIMGKDVPPRSGTVRWSNLQDSHELYNVGHLYEAAAAHYLATGKRTLLDVALKNADLLLKTFGEDKLIAVPGHQEIELGLVKLYRITGKLDYLQLAKFFLDYRGRSDKRTLYVGDWLPEPSRRLYSQDFAPVISQTEAVGHAVRAGYMYAGMSDIAALTGDQAYLKAVRTIWENVTGQKTYLTGGVGASESGEDFGGNYELPNATAYNETCAAIAMMIWNHRLFLLSGDACYLDVLEQTLYNGFLSGVGLEGNLFFYPNPLASDGKTPFNEKCATRVPWFDCSCCPSNIVRFLPSLPGYVYAQEGRSIYVNLFLAGKASFRHQDTELRLIQETEYPWQGKILLRVDPAKAMRFTLRLRLPGWSRNAVWPGGLYQFAGSPAKPPAIRLNGKKTPLVIEKGFALLDRTWQAGDRVELELPLPVQAVHASEKVSACQGLVAFQRGPLVYCAEGADHSGHVLDLAVSGRQSFKSEYVAGLLGGIVRLHGEAMRPDNPRQPVPLVLVPYYAWSHRGPGEMAVWLKQSNLSKAAAK